MNRPLLNSAADFGSSRKTVEVDCPELGYTIRLRELTMKQLSSISKDDTSAQLALMIVDDEGKRIFTSEDDIRKLDELSVKSATRLMVAAAELNGIAQTAIDESIKNLLASPTDDSVGV